jgi:DNA-binding LacI/PurR family transcriptional regulator
MRANGNRVGIRDVARAAGVSVTTVSHALNDKGRLPEDTRRRVRAVAEELGYRPNVTARNLVGGRTGLLGLVISQPPGLSPTMSDFAYFTELMAGASTVAMRRGYALILAPPGGDVGLETGLAIDGAIVVDPVAGDALTRELMRSGMPVVTTGRAIDPGVHDAWVDNDHVAGVRSVLDHLRRQGARRIALMTISTVMSYTGDVERGYADWCAEHGQAPRVEKLEGDLTESAGFACASDLLSSPEPPDAIFASYDRLAYGALLAARARDVRVPEDLLLAMTATEATTRSAGPAITGLHLLPGTIGGRAAALLVDLVEGREPGERQVVVPTRLIPRASTRRSGH